MSIPSLGSQPDLFGWYTSNFTNTTLVVNKGYARNNFNTFGIESTGPLTLDIATLGAGGCWPVGIAAQTPVSGLTGVSIFAIGDSTGANAADVIAVTADFEALPAGYDSFRFVGIFILDNSGHIIPVAQTGAYGDKYYALKDPLLVLNAGAETSVADLDLTTLSGGVIGQYLLVNRIDFNATFTPNNAANIASLAPGGVTPASTFPTLIKTNGTAAVSMPFSMTPGPDDLDEIETADCVIQYKVTSGSDALSLWITGFECSIGLAGISLD